MSRKDTTLDLAKLVDKGVRVKLAGGREGRPQCAQAVLAVLAWV